MRFRTWRAIALLLSLLLILAACGADDEPPVAEPEPEPTDEPDDGDEDDVITRADADLVIWADDTRVATITPFAEQFGEEHGVTVAVQELNFGDIRDHMIVAGPAGEGADVFIGAHDWLGQLVAAGVVEPLDLEPIADEFLPAAIQAFNYEGQYYGLPYAIENIALVRNADLVPDAPSSWDELKEVALGLVADGTVEIPLALQWNDPYHEYPLVTASGGYVFGLNDDGSYNPDDLGLDSDGGLAAARSFAQWIDEGLIDPNVNYDIMIESFGTGNAPFAITGPWAIHQPDNGFRAMGVNYVVEPIPPVNGGEAKPFVGVQGFMVSAFAPSKLLAQTFVLEFMSTEEAQVELYKVGGRAPALVSAFEEASSDPDIQGFGLAGANGHPMPAIPQMGSVWEAWTNAYTLIGQGTDPETAFGDAAEPGDDIDVPEGDAAEGFRIDALMDQGRSATFHATYEADHPTQGTLHGRLAQDQHRAAMWRSDSETDEGRTFANVIITEPEGTVISCIWLGDVDHEDIDEWECARAPTGDARLFDAFFGPAIFGAEEFPVDDVTTTGWETLEEAEIAGRTAECGSSPAFAEAVSRACFDVELGIPVVVESDDLSMTLVTLRDPDESDFDPPAEPWEDPDAHD
jgi:arabinogalactan oligomer / maltooligosaccharide transport system substrate-binding protein